MDQLVNALLTINEAYRTWPQHLQELKQHIHKQQLSVIIFIIIKNNVQFKP